MRSNGCTFLLMGLALTFLPGSCTSLVLRHLDLPAPLPLLYKNAWCKKNIGTTP
uniref:Uncharacterized protein n=1 Tax=Phocoena sinus TaxID=42100 RepID=A0A8C9C8Y0_PHOSS